MLEQKTKKSPKRWRFLKSFDIYAKPITMTYRGKEKFRNIVENQVQNPHNPDGCCNCFHERTPDYAIRLEHLYEDWLNQMNEFEIIIRTSFFKK